MRQVPNFSRRACAIVGVFLLFTSLGFASPAHKAREFWFGHVHTLVLSGSYQQMGRDYGHFMAPQLRRSLTTLTKFYKQTKTLSYAQLAAEGERFYQRFPLPFQRFMQGVAQGSGLPLIAVKITNAMETMGELLPKETGHCTFIDLPRNKTLTKTPLIGRNYDFPKPYDQIAKDLTVTILHSPDSIPTALIALPGEIYCPSCVNAKGLFMELNAGSPSGGATVIHDRQSLLITLLQTMQHANNLAQLQMQLNASQSDYSLIINAADTHHVASYEFSSTLGMKHFSPAADAPFVSTNFYLDPRWQHLPTPTDATTWMGVTRRNNLLTLARQHPHFSLEQFKVLMNKTLAQGGAVQAHTIYQLIYTSQRRQLLVKIHGDKWTSIPLAKLFTR